MPTPGEARRMGSPGCRSGTACPIIKNTNITIALSAKNVVAAMTNTNNPAGIELSFVAQLTHMAIAACAFAPQ